MRQSQGLLIGAHALILLAAPAAGAPQTPGAPPDGKTLFLEHCASCHGESGDGQGVTQLDRPARSFMDGGFSFGNTPEALFRTLSTGIPGTPMPGFDSAIDEPGRRALALYVRSLGPPIEETDVSGAILEVQDTPLVVRGHLPPISEDAQSHPRGLLIGTTSGLTFEYRADDVRLLGVRQGPFVERLDWAGRGGSPLQPLGPVIHTLHGGVPEALFQRIDGSRARTLTAKLRSTWVRPTEVGLTYELMDEAGESWARVEESVRAVATPRASGFERTFAIEMTSAAAESGGSLSGDLIAPLGIAMAYTEPMAARHTLAYRSDDGGVQVVSVTGASSLDDGRVNIAGASMPRLVVTTLLCPKWDDETQAAVRKELER
ncbi:MAG: mono/diheme cytochrome c family protein [Chlamydiales bacterium]|jgi:mono/diheme cytochrome c family protein